MPTTILLRGGTASEWTTADPVLAFREVGLETDTERRKVGDGSTAWSSLPYYDQGLSAALDAASTDDLLGVASDGTVKKVDSGTYRKRGLTGLAASEMRIVDGSPTEADVQFRVFAWSLPSGSQTRVSSGRLMLPAGKTVQAFVSFNVPSENTADSAELFLQIGAIESGALPSSTGNHTITATVSDDTGESRTVERKALGTAFTVPSVGHDRFYCQFGRNASDALAGAVEFAAVDFVEQ